MKPMYRRSLPVFLLILAFILAGLPSANASGQSPTPGAESYDVHTYIVSNVSTKEDRTAVAQTGAAIEEIGANYVIVSATEQEAKQIAKLGYP
ncbi:hypothetical protein JZU69_00450, partial [bacterium]|nr:hypothetical protein [bacterium]